MATGYYLAALAIGLDMQKHSTVIVNIFTHMF